MTAPMTWTKLALASLATLSVATAQPFASRIASYSGLGAAPYGDPTAALGAPTTWVQDTSANGGPNQRIAVNPGYGAWGVSPEGNANLVTVLPGGHLTLEFDEPIRDNPKNWYGYDFIVFGNAFFPLSDTLRWNTLLQFIFVMSGPDWLEPMQVSVSPDGIQWFSYPITNTSAADAFWPTCALAWDRIAGTWGTPQDFQKPVRPTLIRSNFIGTLATAIDKYEGSGGGTAFDLSVTPFRSIRFIRFSGNGGEIDAVSRVRPAYQQP